MARALLPGLHPAQVEPVGHRPRLRQRRGLQHEARLRLDHDRGLDEVAQEVSEGARHPHLDAVELRRGRAGGQEHQGEKRKGKQTHEDQVPRR
ncbi:hypothetical protein [Methylobacterium gregans]|uniref:hypothetical protein n=1 Tax=Methylobacterium gregans TaxID=374424 RepID=UPI00360E2A39